MSNSLMPALQKPRRYNDRWMTVRRSAIESTPVPVTRDIVAGREQTRPPASPTPTPAAPAQPSRFDIRGYLWAIALSLLTTAIGWPLYHGLNLTNTNVLMLYLLVVLWVASRHSRSAAVLASVLSVALFDVCFVPPFLKFTVADQQYIITFAAMLLTALLISALTHQVRAQAESARERERRTAAMLSLNRDLAAARGIDEIAAAAVKHMAELFGGRRTAMFLVDNVAGDQLDFRAASSGDREVTLQPHEKDAALWSLQHNQPAGAGTAMQPLAKVLCLPLKSARGPVGVVVVLIDKKPPAFGLDRRQLAEAFASQVALAIERATLADEARRAWERVEAEFLRNTLLSGVSHELRTPLAAITGAASTLIETGQQLSAQARADMLDTIYAESERMERLITNLLDMTRLESGGLVVKKEWLPLQEVVGTALHHLDRRLRGRNVSTKIPADLPLVQFDGVAIEQVLVNLIDNAVEYTPPGAAVDISATAGEKQVAVEVADRGPGLPPGTEARVFEKFFRAHAPGRSQRGVGLGLAICRGIVEAHGGTISASNRVGGGAVFRFTLPLVGQAPSVDSSE
jgi:two-component system sensor histidine kinase KdpD